MQLMAGDAQTRAQVVAVSSPDPPLRSLLCPEQEGLYMLESLHLVYLCIT